MERNQMRTPDQATAARRDAVPAAPTIARVKVEVPGVRPTYSGKVRDLYDLGDRLLIVATDRISAYDSILPTGIPGKGWLLTQLYLKYQLGQDPRELLDFQKSLEPLTPQVVQEAARAYLDTGHYVRVTLYPEKEKGK